MRLKLVFVVAMAAALFGATPEEGVRSVLDSQVAAWNRGDLVEFVSTYSAETVFVGKTVSRGDAEVLERYRRNYPTKEKMGTLNYSDVEVRMLGKEYASVIGRFHLTRTAEGGGDASGIYNLVLRKTAKGWKVILDHTS